VKKTNQKQRRSSRLESQKGEEGVVVAETAEELQVGVAIEP
jgi:hypothetical protein